MADDSDLERSEAPSQRRLEKAREDGQVARSRELSTLVLMLASGAVFAINGAGWIKHLSDTMHQGMHFGRAEAFSSAMMGQRLENFSADTLISLAPFFGLLMVVATGAPLLLGGWTFSVTAFSPDVNRINPLSGLKRMVSGHGLTELIKALLKTAILAAIGGWLLWRSRDLVSELANEDLLTALSRLGRLLASDLLILCGGLAVIALFDAPYQMMTMRNKLKMTKQQIVDEHREMEGDPRLKAQIRRLQRAISKRRMMAAIPKADVVVVNPSHYSVALSYKDNMRAPRVVAKGIDETAARIREIAAEHGVPLLEAPPLARALYKHTDLDCEIPTALYEAVALVMAYIFQLRRAKAGGDSAPLAPYDLPVPADLDPLNAVNA
jgi:flagellar biosynthetic protein FlhB